MPALRAEQLGDGEPQAPSTISSRAPACLPSARCPRARPASSWLVTPRPPSSTRGPTTAPRCPCSTPTPADLAAFAAELGQSSLDEVLDRRLTAPLIHELSHFGRERVALLPLYLDECIAAHVGVLALPELAYPAAGEDNGLYAAPWLTHQALARIVGLEPLARAHAGVASWNDVMPPGLRDALCTFAWGDYLAHRGPHLLSDNFRPDPWLALIHEHDERQPDDLDTLTCGLRAMCLPTSSWAASFAPPRICPELAYPLPRGLARRWQAAGLALHVVEIAQAAS